MNEYQFLIFNYQAHLLMAQKDNFQREVVQTLLNSGFKEIFEQKQHKEFIEMIAATYFSNQLTFDGIIEYLADINEDEAQKKAIAEIIRDAKIPKVQKKPQQPQQKDEKVETVEIVDKVQKKPQKKIKPDYHTKPRQTKQQKTEQSKKQPIQGQPEATNGGQRKGLKQELEATGKAKCRFFPFCKNQETCEFFHPTDKCQYFPNCRYGENCLYVHETCKFKQRCSKMNCPYAHPGKRPSNPLEAFMKNMMMSKNPGMFNKHNNNNKKKRTPHQDNKQDEQQQQQ